MNVFESRGDDCSISESSVRKWTGLHPGNGQFGRNSASSWRLQGEPLAAKSVRLQLAEARSSQASRVRNRETEADPYCTVGSTSSGAPCLRNNCGRFCENADRGSTMSQPTSCAFCFKSP